MQTLDQIRAKFAWDRVNRVEPEIRREYRNLAKSLPALVMSNGLMQTVAYLQAKADNRKRNEHAQLRDHILEWLVREDVIGQPDFESAMKWSMTTTTLEYQRATEETQAILRWIRQLADTVKE